MTSDDYGSVPSTGKLKLKGTSDGRIDKKKKKKLRPKENDESTDKSVVLKKLEEEDVQIAAEETKRQQQQQGGEMKATNDGEAADTERNLEGEVDSVAKIQLKTESERRFDEQRRKRLEEKLKREGVKTHKQRVEELNKYLSGLSEHHDMPRIGPG